MFCVGVKLYHLPLVPAPFANPHKREGAVPVSLVNAGAVVVEFKVTDTAVAQLDCAEAIVNDNRNKKDKIFLITLNCLVNFYF
jgi:hypothetical protein